MSENLIKHSPVMEVVEAVEKQRKDMLDSIAKAINAPRESLVKTLESINSSFKITLIPSPLGTLTEFFKKQNEEWEAVRSLIDGRFFKK